MRVKDHHHFLILLLLLLFYWMFTSSHFLLSIQKFAVACNAPPHFNHCSTSIHYQLNTSFLVRSSTFLLTMYLLLLRGKMKENEEEYPPEDD